MVKGKESSKTGKFVAEGKTIGKSKVGLHCIGEICFNENGFIIKLPEDADPECAKKTAQLILRGNSNVVFEVPGRGIVKDPTEIGEDDGEGS
jgi:hypothetical protein